MEGTQSITEKQGVESRQVPSDFSKATHKVVASLEIKHVLIVEKDTVFQYLVDSMA
jgi:DNA topoisomerase VI subunit A